MARTESPPAAALPLGEHNQRLLSNTHPSDWVNPEPKDKYDLVVLGGGTGGLVTAAIGASLGAHVALVERQLLGGDCLNVGCVPSKAILRSARSWSAARDASVSFAGPAISGDGDFAAAMDGMRRIRADLSPTDSAARFRDLGADVFFGSARFSGVDRVEVSGCELRFRRAVIATGTRPVVPPLPGLAETGYLTNETIFSLTSLPARLIIIGGGAVGCELAQAFARFGSRVSLIEAAEQLLPREDPDATRLIRAALEGDGVEVFTSARATGVNAVGGERRVSLTDATGERVIAADAILVAIGRVPNVEELNLDAAGVRVGDRGVVTDDRMRTSNSRVYAVGDVTGGFQLTHAADAQARLAVQNALFFGRKKASRLVMPWCTYTQPEVAHVGITAREAALRGGEVDTVTVAFAEIDRARLEGATDGFLRVHLRHGSDSILGATVVGEHAGELIAPLTIAMTAGFGLDTVGGAIFPYPTLTDVLRRAADARRRERLTPTVRKVFEIFLRLMR